MSRNSTKKKKSTSKYHGGKVSFIIPVIAIIEVLVLVVASSYAWYVFSANKTLSTGTISVEADSGLDIDFQYSNVSDYINIWNYIDTDFSFEPATSLDGRNIYFPTSSTFSQNKTGIMSFRDGTINDINTKYLNIDFELTNTSNYDMEVYLNNSSYFRVKDGSGAEEESRALRLAFYTNDGNSGNVGSSLINTGSNQSTDGAEEDAVTEDYATFYFDTVANSSWSRVYAYFYDSDHNPATDEWSEYYQAWPGVEMSYNNGKIFSLTIKESELTNYDKVIFTDGYSGTNSQTTARDVASVKNKKAKMYSEDLEGYIAQTIYFIKPYAWSNLYCKTYTTTDNKTAYNSGQGDTMKYVGSGIYSYTYYYQYISDPGTESEAIYQNIKSLHFNNGSWNGTNQTNMIEVNSTMNGHLYYVDGLDEAGTYKLHDNGLYSSLGYNTVYFFNTYGWEKPYATVTIGSGSQANTCNLPMVSLSGNVYYCTVPNCYDHVYFRDVNQESRSDPDLRSSQVVIENGKVYRAVDSLDIEGFHELVSFVYETYIRDSGYPVISPGVSVGFQRPYAPVVTIDNATGKATEIVPAFSNSIDTYILGSNTPIFILGAKHMMSLSMIVWLEGTDAATDDDTYPGNNIELKLEFSTMYKDSNNEEHIVNPGKDTGKYTYHFYDKTREVWTSNRQSTESGVTVAPVMQLYDNTTKRGYLMHASDWKTYDGSKKVTRWTVEAPQSIAVLGHDIIFRRVNPYDEDEVWNYWHAGRVAGGNSDTVYYNYDEAGSTRYSPYDIAFTGGTTISFTAFSDGSPTRENLYNNLYRTSYSTYYNEYITDNSLTASEMTDAQKADADAYAVTQLNTAVNAANVPTVSCGGLWGNHQVRTLTMYDGLEYQPLKNNNGIITINYSYAYTVHNTTTGDDDVIRTANIEYKASGPNYNSIYYIVMPNAAYTNQLPCTFKSYTGFQQSYAINSERNVDLAYSGKYGENKLPTGDYFELCHSTDGSDFSYWGTDMLYIQTSYYTKDDLKTTYNEKLLQVHFFTDPDGVDENKANDFYSYLYYNAEFNPNGASDVSAGTGFATVIPNDKRYYYYRVENCDYHGDRKYNITPKQEISHTETASIFSQDSSSGYTMPLNHVSNKNICKLDYFYVMLYTQISGTFANNSWCPELYQFWGNANNNWDRRPEMEYVETVGGYYKFKGEVNLSLYGNVIISNEYQKSVGAYGTHKTETINLRNNAKTQNGMIIQIASASGDTFNYEILKRSGTDYTLIQDGEIDNETIKAVLYTSETFPHYVKITAKTSEEVPTEATEEP